jgi:hypothetical protein
MAMNKPVISASARNPKTGKFAKVRGRPVLGVTQDGVAILKPRQGATHFTTDEIRRAIARVRKTTPAE